MKYYIAYGSNLNTEQMAFRCPAAKQAQTAMLPDYQLEFRGARDHAYLTITPEKGGSLPILLWTITERDEKALDRYEGYPNFYRKETLEVEIGGRKQEAMVYIMNEGCELGLPSEAYLETVLAGYEELGFPSKFVEDAFALSRQKMQQKQNNDFGMKM